MTSIARKPKERFAKDKTFGIHDFHITFKVDIRFHGGNPFFIIGQLSELNPHHVRNSHVLAELNTGDAFFWLMGGMITIPSSNIMGQHALELLLG